MHLIPNLSKYVIASGILIYFKKAAWTVPTSLCYVYFNAAEWMDFHMVVSKVEILPDQEHIKLTRGLFFPQEFILKIAETTMSSRSYLDGPTLNYF